MKLAKDLLICCALIALSAFLIRGAMFLQSAQGLTNAGQKTADASRKVAEGIDSMRATIEKQLTGKYGLINELTAAARESRKTIDVLQKTSLAERAKVAAFSDASIRAVNDLDGVVRETQATVHSLQGATGELGRLATALKVDAESAKPTIDGATALLATLNTGSGQTLGRVNATVGHVDDLVVAAGPIEKNLESTSKHIDGASAKTEETLGYIRDNFKPTKRSFWVKLLDSATAGMFSVVLHWVPQRVTEVH